MRRAALILATLCASACSDSRTLPLDAVCEGPRLERVELDGEWYYRRTVVDSGPLDGLGDLRRVSLRVEGDTLVIDGDTRWPVRTFNLVCPEGQFPVEVDSPAGVYVGLDGAGNTEEISTINGWTATFTPSAAVRSLTAPGFLDLEQRGLLTLELSACADLGVPDCATEVQLRHMLIPIPDGDGFAPAERTGAFGLLQVNGQPQRASLPVTYYLAPGTPAEVVQAAADVAMQIDGVIGGFSVRPNSCSTEGLAAAVAEAPELADIEGDLLTRCAAFEARRPDVFTWQRPGDLRFNTIGAAARGGIWATHAARAVDETTGQILAADLLVDQTVLDDAVAQVVRHATDDDPASETLVFLAAQRALAIEQARLPRALALSSPPIDRTLSGLSTRLARIAGTTVENAGNDSNIPFYVAGPTRLANEPVDDSLRRFAGLEERIELTLERAERRRAARALAAGYSGLTAWTHPGYAAVAQDYVGRAPAEIAADVSTGLATHWLAHGLLHNLGLADNPAGSFEASSIMDVIPAEDQLVVQSLGPYDRAALAYLYRGGPAETSHAHCGVETAMTTPTIRCAVDDWGTSARASFAHAYSRWLGHYYFTQIVDDPTTFSATRATRPAVTAFWRASAAAQEAAALLASDPTVASTERFLDLLSAAYHGVNLAHEILSVPEAGRFCALDGSEPPAYFAGRFFREEACNPAWPLDSREAIVTQAFEIPLGIGREAVFARPQEDAPWTRMGRAFDASVALFSLHLAFPTDVQNDAPPALVDVAPGADSLYLNIINSDPYILFVSNARRLGMNWCRLADDPESPWRGFAEPARFFDVIAGQPDPGPSPACVGAGAIMPSLSEPALRTSLFVRQALAVGDQLLIYRVGVDDQNIDWTADPTDVCEFRPFTGPAYRALNSQSPQACVVLDRADNAREASGFPDRSDPFREEIYERWLEMVGHAHVLRTLYDP